MNHVNAPEIATEYDKNGIIYLADFLDASSLQALIQEIDQGQLNAEKDIANHWNNNRVCFYSKNAEKSDKAQHDFATEDYFQRSHDKAHVFYENIGSVLAVNRIGHGMHLVPEFKNMQKMVYENDRLTNTLKSIGFIKPICHLSVYIPKYPHSIGSDVRPHQESTFAYTEPQSVVVLWLALEDARIDNACMWGILGSHKWPLQYISRVNHVNKTRHFERVNDDICIPDFNTKDEHFTPLEVKAGDALLFHGNFVHCSPINNSDRSRKALSLQFIETHDVMYASTNWLQPPNKHYIFNIAEENKSL
jgi:phytanoyl-CoA hydroxylase